MGFFLPVPPAAGGATEKTWHRLALEFARRGHDVTLVSRQWAGWPDDERRDGVTYRRLPGADHTAHLPLNLLHDFRWSMRVARNLPAADITVVNSVTFALLPPSWRRHAGRLVVMTGRIPKRQFRFYQSVDRVLAVSTAVLERVKVENPRAAERGIVTGYPIDWARLSAPRSGPRGVLTVGFVGRIHREKGLHLLAEAARLLAARSDLPPWRVLVCGPADVARGGSGPAYRQELQALLDAPGPAHEFRDPVFDDHALAEIYRGIDVFAYPSLSPAGETFGVAVAEAMAAGAVPVVSALPCFSDYLEPGVNGESFDHGATDSAARLAGVIANLLRDAPRRERMATAARESVRRYDLPAYADRLLADFSTLK